MNTLTNKFKPSTKGFTIIELIVVIAIIAVLAGIVLISVTQYTAKSKVAALKASLRSMQQAAAVFIEANSTLNYSSFLTDTGSEPAGDPKAVEICTAIKTLLNSASCGLFTASTDGKKYCYMAPTSNSVGYHYACVDSSGSAFETTDSTSPATCSDPATASCQ